MPTERSLKKTLKKQKKRLVHGYELARRKKTVKPKGRKKK